MLATFAPVIALVSATVALGVIAWSSDLYRREIHVAAQVTGAAAGMLAMVLLYRQIRRRQASGRALQSVTARVSDIVETAMDPIVTIDATQRIVLFNAAAEKVFGWPRAAVVGQSVEKLIPERFRDKHREHIERFGRTGATTRRMGGHTILAGLRASGEQFPIEASISQHSEDGMQFFTVILRDVSERVRIESQLQASREELRNLAAAANQAREQEQSRLARELHDELAQTLTALQMDVAWCKSKIPESDPATIARHTKMEATLKSAVANTRRIAGGLRPLMLDDLGLVPAVDWLVEGFTQRNGIPCDLVVGSNDLNLPNAQATAVFRIIQESLVNVGKHARATRVKVSLERNGAGLIVGIVDDGVGFSPQDPRKPNSFGLLGLRERALLLGGEIAITSAPGKGTNVVVRLPLSAQGLPT